VFAVSGDLPEEKCLLE